MVEKGEWSLADYKCELAKTKNQKERLAILTEKEKIKKREIELQIAECDQAITKIQNDSDILDKTIVWIESMIKKLETQS
jgi:hypothetical protein